jgi:hypothetical protein
MSVLLVPGEDLAHFPRRLALILVLLVPKVLEAVDEEVGDAFSWFASLFQTMITRSFAILSILSLVVVTPEKRDSPPPSPCSRGAVRGVPRD